MAEAGNIEEPESSFSTPSTERDLRNFGRPKGFKIGAFFMIKNKRFFRVVFKIFRKCLILGDF